MQVREKPTMTERLAKIQFTHEQAFTLSDSQWWIGVDAVKIAQFQLSQKRLCVDFGVFQKAVEQALGRPVWTHEFAYPDDLWDELHEKRNPPSMGEIIAMLPSDKIIIVESEHD